MAIAKSGPRLQDFNPEWLHDAMLGEEAELIGTYSRSNEWLQVVHAELGDPVYAYEVLNNARASFHMAIEVNLQLHSPLGWLHLLRECPDHLFRWENSTVATSLMLRELSEVSTGSAPSLAQDGPQTDVGSFVIRLSPPGLSAVLKVIAATRIIKRLQSLARLAAKGVGFAATTDFPPQPDLTYSQGRAVAIYDRRLNEQLRFLWGPEKPLHKTTHQDSRPDINVLAVRRLPNTRMRLEQGSYRPVAKYFDVSVTDLSTILDFNRAVLGYRPSWYDPTAVPSFLLLHIALGMVRSKPPSIWAIEEKGTLHFGSECELVEVAGQYFPQAARMAIELFPGANVPRDVGALFEELQAVQASVWPPRPGPFFRRHGDVTAVDLCAATNALLIATRMPLGTGAFANERSSRFETDVQAVIDDSPWAPNGDIRWMRGRTLLKDRMAITDIDAIGTNGRVLLLVDCLDNVREQHAVFTGDYTTYRNLASRLEDKVAGDIRGRRLGWVDKVMPLVGRRGDNWDFRAYDSAIPLVVTSAAVYVEESLVGRPACASLREIMPGLTLAPTLVELKAWLHGAERLT